ncbi:MAG: putative ABC transporter permease [Clostridiales bacterium]|nr:putative ABC transporter permease [Clostridiales bacterium]
MIRIGGRIRSLDLMTLFRWFIIYSVMGWTYETVFTFLIKGDLTNRGFLFGPLCPIYGLSILIMILICPDRGKNIVSLIIKCAFVATTMEYITSSWMERFFAKRWWDYSDMFMNVNGRICLGASVLFGVLGAIFVRYIHPALVSLTNRISNRVMRIFDRTVLILFLYDILLSFRTNII